METPNRSKYAFILGHNPTLSIAEILNVFEHFKINYTLISASKEALLLDIEKELENPPEFIDRLGGTIKIAKIILEEDNTGDFDGIFQTEKIHNDYWQNFLKKTTDGESKKIHWGISAYFLFGADNQFKKEISKKIQRSLFKAKKEFSREKISIRIIIPPAGKISLDSAAVFNNKLLEKGGEMIILIETKKIYLAKTAAIQNFESYGLRDYGRPCRNMKIGMMPPKLAQIMINLAQTDKNEIILDPFCGTGVILQEALLLGYKTIGADIVDGILNYSRKNISWLKENYKLEKTEYELYKRDARDISKIAPNNFVGGIVTEGTLGPKYANKAPNEQEMRSNFKQLELLYIDAFKEFAKILKKDAKIVISFPFYRLNGQKIALAPFIDKIKATGYNILCPIKTEAIKKNFAINLTARNTILYERASQIVGREIVIFVKK